MFGKIVPKIGINWASLFPFTMLGVDFAGNMIQIAGLVVQSNMRYGFF